jgi:Type II/IV secretion system protein
MPDNENPNADDPQKTQVEVQIEKIPGPDFTVYDKKGAECLLLQGFHGLVTEAQANEKERKKYSHAFPACIQHSNGMLYGRALACSAYGAAFWSLTVRCDEPNTRPRQDDFEVSLKQGLDDYVAKSCREEKSPRGKVRHRDALGYCPQGYKKYSSLVIDEPPPALPKGAEPQKDIFLNDIYVLCNLLKKLLFNGLQFSSHSSGLLAITGTTDSSKSLITRGLIFLLLEEAAQRAREEGQRKPHLVTFEDPIEQYYVKSPATKTAPRNLADLEGLLNALYVDYTPREKDSDAGSLREVTKDALRQTPAVLFVGETRETADWRDLLEFASSGHLVITTSHASSVVEAMTGIFRATETKTPAQRSEMARRILGIINIRSFHPPAGPATPPGTAPAPHLKTDSKVRALLPALWKSTSQSKSNLVADGLASLLPALGHEPEIGYYSRTHFANELTQDSVMTDDIKMDAPRCTEIVNSIKRKAREWDIEGV